MKGYTHPVIITNDELAEGVYMASGDACYSCSAFIHQKPELGRGDYRIQVNGIHSASDGHHSGKQVLTLSFNFPVTYKDSQGTLIGGDGTNILKIEYGYHNNGNDNIGLGDVIVEADNGLAVTGSILDCNHDCGQH